MKGRNTEWEGSLARRRSDTQKERIRTSRERGSESGVERTGMGVFLFTRGFGFARGGRAPWSRRVDATTDHETHPSTLGPNRTSTGSTVSRGSPSAQSAARKIEIFFPRDFSWSPFCFPERGARRSASPRRDAPRHSRRAFARVGPPSSREAFLAQVRANPRRARALRPAPSRDLATVARARRVICRVCASASSSPARCAGVREFACGARRSGSRTEPYCSRKRVARHSPHPPRARVLPAPRPRARSRRDAQLTHRRRSPLRPAGSNFRASLLADHGPRRRE